jgi:hypothetical protein
MGRVRKASNHLNSFSVISFTISFSTVSRYTISSIWNLKGIGISYLINLSLFDGHVLLRTNLECTEDAIKSNKKQVAVCIFHQTKRKLIWCRKKRRKKETVALQIRSFIRTRALRLHNVLLLSEVKILL